MTEQAKHVAARVDEGEDLRFVPENRDSLCPGDWTYAFLQSEDKSDEEVLAWFTNAMTAARYGEYDQDPPMPWD